MAILAGVNGIKYFIGYFDKGRSSNVFHTHGWEGESYLFQKKFVYQGDTFTAATMEIQGSSLEVVEGVLTGTVETMRFSYRSGVSVAEITDLNLSAETLFHYMRSAERGGATVQGQLQVLIESTISKHFLPDPPLIGPGHQVFFRDSFKPEAIYLSERGRVTVYNDDSWTGNVDIFGTPRYEYVEFYDYATGTVFYAEDYGVSVNGQAFNLHGIEAIKFAGRGLTFVGHATDADVFISKGHSGPEINRLEGHGGNDRLISHRGLDVLDGGSGDDSLTSGDGDDTIYAGIGNDYVDGAAGADLLVGGQGNDTLAYSTDTNGVSINLTFNSASGGQAAGDSISSFENVIGGSGNDTLSGNDQSNLLHGGRGLDRLSGGGGDDTLHGGSSGDVLRGGAGNDVIDGGNGFDQIVYTVQGGRVNLNLENRTATGFAGNDIVLRIEHAIGSAFGDTIYGTHAHGNRLEGSAGNDRLFGLSGQDTLLGGNDNDALFGGNDVDHLFGQLGDDTLDGGMGTDFLAGGVGADTFVFSNAAHTGVGKYKRDEVRDFNRLDGDKIDLSRIDANANLAGNQTFQHVSAFTGTAGELTLKYHTLSGNAVAIASMDVNGDGRADSQIYIVDLAGSGSIQTDVDFIL